MATRLDERDISSSSLRLIPANLVPEPSAPRLERVPRRERYKRISALACAAWPRAPGPRIGELTISFSLAAASAAAAVDCVRCGFARVVLLRIFLFLHGNGTMGLPVQRVLGLEWLYIENH